MIKFLDWDSNFFGYKIGKIENTENDVFNILNYAKKEEYTLLYGFLSPNDILNNYFYQKNKGILVDEKITFLREIPMLSNFENNLTEIYTENTTSKDLISLALQSGEYSRFKMDKNFQNNEFERLYKIWIEKSVKKEIAKKIIVQKENEKIIGLLTLGIKNNRADIGILAVDTTFRKQKIGKNLVEKSFMEALLLGQKEIQVVTQKANKSACFFYQKMNFDLEKIENVYHFWL